MNDDLQLLVPVKVLIALKKGTPDSEILAYLEPHMQGAEPQREARSLLDFYKSLAAGEIAA